MATDIVKVEDVPDEGQGVVVSAVELARMIATTRENVQRMAHQGCPVYQKGVPGGQPTLFALGPWFRWIQLRARTASGGGRPGGNTALGDARERQANAIADKRELEVQKMLGELFPIADWGPFIDDEMVSLRTAMMGIGESLREEVGKEMADRIEEMVRTRLNAFVDGMQNIPNKIADPDFQR